MEKNMTRTIIAGARAARVKIIGTRKTSDGRQLVTVKRVNDAGASPRSGFDELKWNYSRSGDTTEMMVSALEARTIR